MPFGDDQSQILNPGLFKFALVRAEVQLVCPEPFQDEGGDPTMFLDGVTIVPRTLDPGVLRNSASTPTTRFTLRLVTHITGHTRHLRTSSVFSILVQF